MPPFCNNNISGKFMLLYPQIDPVAVALGPVKIHWYGLMYVLAFITAFGLATFRSKSRDGWTSEMVSDLLFYGMLGVILGGRIGYVLFYEFDQFLADPVWLFKVWTFKYWTLLHHVSQPA
jgi:phosphatidylglycerol:prolipoprotein diacylglycerol transferase